MSRGRILIAVALVLALALVGVYAAAGGASYEPVQVQNPCEPRAEKENSGGLEGLAEEFTLSALDGAACRLGVSRLSCSAAATCPPTSWLPRSRRPPFPSLRF